MVNEKDSLQAILEGMGDDVEITPDEETLDKTYFTNVVVMDDEAFADFTESEEFQEGLALGAKYAGVYTAMVNVGAEVSFAQDIAFNVQMADIAEMNNKYQKDIATVTSKNMLVASEKSQL